MNTIPLSEIFAKMPVKEMDETLQAFLAPVTELSVTKIGW